MMKIDINVYNIFNSYMTTQGQQEKTFLKESVNNKW